MSTFGQIINKQVRPPGRTLVLPTWVWADEWQNRPTDEVCVGLRLMPDADKSKARSEAERLADELHARRGPNWVDAFNDCLVRQVAALGICDPNDVSKPSSVLPLAEDQVRVALTTEGARFIFDAYQVYELEASPLSPEATDEELLQLSQLLWSDADRFRTAERRLLKDVLERMQR